MLILINIMLVSLNNVSGYYWTTMKTGSFSYTYEGESDKVITADSTLDISISNTYALLDIKAVGENYWFTPGEASVNEIFDTSVPSNGNAYGGKAGESYRAYATFRLNVMLSGSNQYVEVTVKLIYFAGGQVDADVATRKFTSSTDAIYTVYTDGYQAHANRNFYVEVVVRVFARSAYGAATSTADLMTQQRTLDLQSWGIQKFVATGPV